MRFRFRRFVLFLLGTVLIALLIVLIVTQKRHNNSSSTQRISGYQRSKDGHSAVAYEIGTNEDAEVRRLLLAGGAASETEEEEETTASKRLEDASAEEMAPALMSLFPVGRFPPALRNNGSGKELTLNLAIVLIVSLLSIAILITAICCVMIVALALDASSARHWSAQHSLTHSSDSFLSSWHGMASQYHRLSQSPVYRTPGLAKLFEQHQHQQEHLWQRNDMMALLNDASMDTPPLTDDEDYDDLIDDDSFWHRLVEEGQCQRLANGTAQPRRKSFTFTSANISPN